VHWVADEAGLAAAMAAAASADAVGLDVEWRPGREGCRQPPAALLQARRRSAPAQAFSDALDNGVSPALSARPAGGGPGRPPTPRRRMPALHVRDADRAQVATRERVWLVDLLALRGGPGLAVAVPALLRAPAALKLGCGLASDLGVLVRGRRGRRAPAAKRARTCCRSGRPCIGGLHGLQPIGRRGGRRACRPHAVHPRSAAVAP